MKNHYWNGYQWKEIVQTQGQEYGDVFVGMDPGSPSGDFTVKARVKLAEGTVVEIGPADPVKVVTDGAQLIKEYDANELQRKLDAARLEKLEAERKRRVEELDTKLTDEVQSYAAMEPEVLEKFEEKMAELEATIPEPTNLEGPPHNFVGDGRRCLLCGSKKKDHEVVQS